VLGLAGALALLPRIASTPAEAAVPGEGAEAWSAERVSALQGEGRIVFVNATAAWCITCQLNERVALRSEAVRTAFATRGVAYLKADWTGGDPAITALLRAHGRDGVPLYLVYPAGGGAPEVLPQILTEGIVLRAIGG
jgi:thiol:disulfide interchange protein